jgi:cytochrome c oxidase assembly protein subunit 15
MEQKSIHRFILIAQITLAFIFIVIIAGSVVRATGSGMGCPDWPKCFGNWIPPTDVSQLPPNYKDLYAGEHHAVAEFNALNTWTEYINRLAGAILGILIFIQLILSFRIRKYDKRIFVMSLLSFFMIGFQGWLGAKVVSSNLAPMKITIHMVMALIILAVAVAIIYRAKKLISTTSETVVHPRIIQLSAIVFFFTIIQIMLGTQVREEVDVLLKNFDATFRGDIIENLGISFIIHRSFSIAIMLVNFFMIYKIIKSDVTDSLKKYGKILGFVLVAELLAGIILGRFAIPAPLQPIHLLLACIAYALQFLIILKVLKK